LAHLVVREVATRLKGEAIDDATEQQRRNSRLL
jgi:hypothetical protein